MHAAGRGGVKAAAQLSGGANPTFGGNGPEDTWMTGGENIAGQIVNWQKKVTDGSASVGAMTDGPDKDKAQKDLDHARKRLAYWQSVHASRCAQGRRLRSRDDPAQAQGSAGHSPRRRRSVARANDSLIEVLERDTSK